MPLFAIGGITSADEIRYEKICGAQTSSDNAGHLGTGGSSCSGCRRLGAEPSPNYRTPSGYETVRKSYLVIVGGAFEEGSKLARARRVAQLAQGFGFDLADAFAGDGE
jgi:hypothetical protein